MFARRRWLGAGPSNPPATICVHEACQGSMTEDKKPRPMGIKGRGCSIRIRRPWGTPSGEATTGFAGNHHRVKNLMFGAVPNPALMTPDEDGLSPPPRWGCLLGQPGF